MHFYSLPGNDSADFEFQAVIVDFSNTLPLVQHILIPEELNEGQEARGVFIAPIGETVIGLRRGVHVKGVKIVVFWAEDNVGGSVGRIGVVYNVPLDDVEAIGDEEGEAIERGGVVFVSGPHLFDLESETEVGEEVTELRSDERRDVFGTCSHADFALLPLLCSP